MPELNLTNNLFTLKFPGNEAFFEYWISGSDRPLHFSFPFFEIEGKAEQIRIDHWEQPIFQGLLTNGVSEFSVTGISTLPDLLILMYIRFADDNPIVRFRYELFSEKLYRLTKNSSADRITYFGLNLSEFERFREVRLSEFNEMAHSNHLTETEIDQSWFESSISIMGPIFISLGKNSSFLIAYEHGSQYPDRFLEYQLHPDHSLSLQAVKANYLHNQIIEGEQSFETIWFEAGGVSGDEKLLAADYRNFIRTYISTNQESRKPYIFYNTWGRQEKIRWAGEQYLTSMNLDYTLKEIDRAHELGIEVYVLDTGWYCKTGDWKINTALFPDNFQQIRGKLSGYGMKLGLWFNPTTAAISSDMLLKNKKFRVTKGGNFDEPYKVWETEESVGLCLVSPYWEDFADRLIELVLETGVTYFKWDAIWQYGCDAPGHFHGDEQSTEQDRKDRYAYLLPIYMSKVIEKVTRNCPDAIFDFDITEEGRCVGLQFLAHGKYFAINNGPYYHNFDVSEEWKSPTADGNPNIFVNPGAARGWFARSVLDYDKWIPSVLFLTHYYPNEPVSSQLQNLASLILGQNGIWGEINRLSEESVRLIHRHLDYYKQVREDVTTSTLFQKGRPGDSCEVYEKINPLTGRGVVVLFVNTRGEYTYITSAAVDKQIIIPDTVSLVVNSRGRAMIKANCGEKDVVIIYFGVKTTERR
jgi:alpha-galactosidase